MPVTSRQNRPGTRKQSIAHLMISVCIWRAFTRRYTCALMLPCCSALLLGACTTPPAGARITAPAGTILSRLPPGTPGAATFTPEREPSAEEKARRYDELDRQALREQDEVFRAEEAAAIAAAAARRNNVYATPYYGGYGGYGGWNGWGGGNGWGWGW